MKKVLALTLAMLLLTALFCGCAQPAKESTAPTADPAKETVDPNGSDSAETDAPVEPGEATQTWYELSDGGAVLTVRLAANATTGYEWNYDISNSSVLELITSEYVPDDSTTEMTGVGGTFVASFRGLAAGNVEMNFYYQQAGSEITDETHNMQIFVNEAGLIEVTSAE